MLSRKNVYYIILFLILGGISLGGITFVDLEISKSMYNWAEWAAWIQEVAILPVVLIAWIAAILITADGLRHRVADDGEFFPIVYLIIGLFSSIGLPIYSYHTVVEFFGWQRNAKGWALIIVMTVFALGAGLRVVRDMPRHMERRQVRRAFVGLLAFYVTWGVSLLVSYLWARVPYTDILVTGDTDSFTAWYEIGKAGGMGTSIFLVMLGCRVDIGLYLLPGTYRSRRDQILIVGVCYGVILGLIGLMTGSLYASEILIGLLLSYIVIFLVALLGRLIVPESSGELLDIRMEEIVELDD